MCESRSLLPKFAMVRAVFTAVQTLPSPQRSLAKQHQPALVQNYENNQRPAAQIMCQGALQGSCAGLIRYTMYCGHYLILGTPEQYLQPDRDQLRYNGQSGGFCIYRGYNNAENARMAKAKDRTHCTSFTST